VLRLAEVFPGLRITLNGGLSASDLQDAAATRLDGLMCGRTVLRRPLDLARDSRGAEKQGVVTSPLTDTDVACRL